MLEIPATAVVVAVEDVAVMLLHSCGTVAVTH
jgi:hypothetical protein